MITTFVTIIVCYTKHATKQVWIEYKNPIAFYKKLVHAQVELGIMHEEDLTANFKMDGVSFWSVMKDPAFIFESFLLILIPYPIQPLGAGIFKFLPNQFTMTAINWGLAKPGDYVHGEIYIVNYQVTDILTVLCFVRIYFLFEAIMVYMPFNGLYGKRVCKESGFEPDFLF